MTNAEIQALAVAVLQVIDAQPVGASVSDHFILKTLPDVGYTSEQLSENASHLHTALAYLIEQGTIQQFPEAGRYRRRVAA